MNNFSTIIPIVRVLIEDEESLKKDIFVYNGISNLFTLTEASVTSIDSVLVNDVESGVVYTFDDDTKKVQVTSSLIMSDVVEVNYNAYENYSDTEITAYIKSALIHLSINNITTYVIEGTDIYPEPDDEETNLIAVIASLLINPQNVSYRMPDISISVPKDLPTGDKIRKIISSYKKAGNIGEIFIAKDDLDGIRN
jgi:hypothetical protein